MNVAAPAEKEKNTQQAEQKKKQKQVEALSLPLRETENANAQTQNPGIQNKGTSSESNNVLSNHNGIPAVHGSQIAYSKGSDLMHNELKASLEQTGDLNHPETQQKELDYKKTLGISDLRDYNDIKSGTYIPKTPAEQVAMVEVPKSSLEPSATAKTPNPEVKKGEGKHIVQQPAVADKTAEGEQQTETKTSQTATDNPGFVALQGQINTTAKGQQQHEPASKSSQDAQAAAPSPANERESNAQANQVSVMDAQEPGVFSAADFKAQLKKKIESIQLPKDEEAADDFEKNNNIKEVNQQALGDVKQEKNAASGAIASETSKKPNTAAQPVRNVAKMPVPNHGKSPAVTNVAKAMPPKRGANNVEQPIQQQTNSVDEKMQENGVTDNMLANSNEPSFTSALDEKNKAKTQSQAATNQFRNNENQQLAKTQGEAQAQAGQQIAGMHTARKGGLNQVHGNQGQTANKDTEKRKEIADRINGIYNTAKTDVDKILASLDTTVAYKFAVGSKAAKAAFEKHVDDNMAAYKRKRYGDANKSYGALAAAGLWLWDKATGLPDEVNKYFVTGKDVYIKTMDYYITDIANHVAAQLNAAKAKIAGGKKAVQEYVNSLSPSLRKLGKAAISEIQSKFNALEENVNSKKDALIDVLAKKYAENVASIDARIEELKAQNSGFINQALNALSGVFAFIIEVKNTLMNLLAKIVEVVGAIISDPIGFFSNLIAGVGQGFSNFITNIWTHLKTGFFGWLTGSMKGITITMPEDIFSIKGIFSLSMQVLGLGWQGIRAIGATVVGEPLMKMLETGVEVVQVVKKDGVAGLWEYLKDQFADLKETVMDAIMDIIQNQVIQAGIKWILGLLSPVGAFVKAIMAIIDVVKFFIQRAAQIAELIKAFMDSVAAIASGKVGAVAKAIENALAKAVPVLIGLLASILGISGLADKVLGVIRKIRQRITAGITKFWNFVKEKGKGLLNKVGIGKKEAIRDSKAKEIENDPNKDWDDVQIPFQGEDHHKHTLYFQDKGGQTVLMVASTPATFSEFIADIKPEKDDDHTKGAKAKAISIAASIDSRKKDKTGNDKAKEKKKKDDIAKLTKELSKHVAVLFGTDQQGGLPDSVIKHTPTTMGGGIMGKSMGAMPLTSKGINGSDPKQTNRVYEDLFYRKEGGRSYYVRGHLLNENLHGEGILTNMTPLSQAGNKNHLRAAEEPIKIAVLGGAIVDYIIVVEYGRSVPDVSDAQLEAAGFESDHDKDIVRRIRKAEQFVPQGISLKSNYMKKDGDRYVKDKVLLNKNSIINPVDLNLKNYKIDSERIKLVSVKTGTVTEIAKNSGLNRYQAEVMQKASNLIPNLSQFKQIIPKLQSVTDEVTADIIAEAIKGKNLGSKLTVKEL